MLSGVSLILTAFIFLMNKPDTTKIGDQTKDPGSGYVIMGYIAGFRGGLNGSVIDAKKLTHINYAFGLIRNGRVVLENPHDTYNLEVLDSLKSDNPDLKILLSVGGWGGSHDFSDVALTPTARLKFARSAVDLVRVYNLDGIDIDWEYPGMVGAGNIYRPEDKQNFTLLLKELRIQLDTMASRFHPGRHYKVTIAAGGSQSFADHTDMKEAQKYLDYVNLMTYDYHTSASDSTGYLTNLYPSPLDPHRNSVQTSVDIFEKAGVPANKIVIGATFYGRGWSGADTLNHGRFLAYSGRGHSFSYDTLRVKYIGLNGFNHYWDSTSQSPYLWNAAKRMMITYDDPRSLKAKADYVRKNNLAGIMFWEYNQDLTGTLLNALYNGLNQ